MDPRCPTVMRSILGKEVCKNRSFGCDIKWQTTCWWWFSWISLPPQIYCDEVYFGEGGLQMDYQIYTNKEYFGEGGWQILDIFPPPSPKYTGTLLPVHFFAGIKCWPYGSADGKILLHYSRWEQVEYLRKIWLNTWALVECQSFSWIPKLQLNA